jgi:5'-nucleotidase
MKILVCNDDGIYSPGIGALADVATAFGTVRIVAPNVEQSATGHAITASRPMALDVTPIVGPDAYRVNGTPADCVSLGAFTWGKPDLVLSGCNLGFNLGHATWHSGTLAAAKQAALLGLRGIAFSAPDGLADFTTMKPWLHRVLEVLIPARELRLVNVNVPREPRGMLWTRISVRQYEGEIVPTKDPQGRTVYWFSARPLDAAEPGTDRWAVEQDWISMTPLGLDITEHRLLAKCYKDRPVDNAMATAASPARSSPAEAQRVTDEEASDASEHSV